MKKLFWIIITIVALIALSLGVYWFFNNQEGGIGGDTTSIGDLFPFGRGEDSTVTPVIPNPSPSQATSTEPENVVQREQLWQISQEPQSGAGIFMRDGAAWVRFVDTATGNVFENKLGESRVSRVSNTTIPKIKEVLWAPKGDSLIARYLGDNGTIQTLHANILPPTRRATTTETGEENIQQLQGTFLPTQITDIAVFAPKERVLYATKTTEGAAVFVANLDGSKATRLFESPIHEWVVSWPTENSAVFTTKPSAAANGFSYIVSTKNGTLQKLIGAIRGLSVLPAANLAYVVYSESGTSGVTLSSYEVKTGAQKNLGRTFAEKCVWMNNNIEVLCAVPQSFSQNNTTNLPDDWYKGNVSFNDSFQTFDVENGRTNTIISPETVRDIIRTGVDATNLTLDPNEEFFVFTNKKDGSLWGARLEE